MDQLRKISRRETAPREVEYEPMSEWRDTLHDFLGVDYPCHRQSSFECLWDQLGRELGDNRGRGSGLDADRALAECLWCLVGHLQPRAVVETGVARGISSRIIIEGLRTQGFGHLWSVDLPPLRDPWFAQVATAVPPKLRDNWTYLQGDSIRLLPRMLRQAAPVDLFLHDSVHDERYMTFEIEHALGALRSGGVLVVDDITASNSFASAVTASGIVRSWVCPHENKESSFGIAVKR